MWLPGTEAATCAPGTGSETARCPILQLRAHHELKPSVPSCSSAHCFDLVSKLAVTVSPVRLSLFCGIRWSPG